MSIASVVLDHILNKDFLKNVIKVGDYLKSRLEDEVIKKYPTLSFRYKRERINVGY